MRSKQFVGAIFALCTAFVTPIGAHAVAGGPDVAGICTEVAVEACRSCIRQRECRQEAERKCKENYSQYCSQCGTGRNPTDKFCSHCGRPQSQNGSGNPAPQ